MATLILDIETVGEKFDDMDETTQAAVTGWVERETGDKQEQTRLLKQAKEGLGFSPLTGQIVALGVLDYEKDKGTVYYEASGEKPKESTEKNFILKPTTEVEMLQNFWRGAAKYDTFVTFNGRSFDIPFLMVRSAINGLQPTKNLMSNRYLNSQWDDAKHIDLYDQLSFYGAVRRPGSLHMWTRAFGIKSPKEDGVDGYQVAQLFADKKYLDIARYNSRDLTATAHLYQRWQTYLKP